MKKQIISISIVLAIVLILAGVGIFIMTQSDKTETGNRLDVAWYDENQEEFEITTVEQFYEFAALSEYYNFEDQTIKLGADLVLNEGNASDWLKNAPENVWSPIKGFAGTFDGQGHTISGIYMKGYNTPVALFIYTETSCQIRNFKLLNSCFDTTGFDDATASIACYGGGKIKQVYSDAILNHNGFYCAGIFSRVTKQTTIEECWFDGTITMTGRNGGGILDAVTSQRATVKHCLFTGDISSTWYHNGARIGGVCGTTINMGSALIMEDCLSVGSIKAEHVNFLGSALGAIVEQTSASVKDVYGSLSTHTSTLGISGKLGTLDGTMSGIAGKSLIGEGGYRWTTLDFDNYWTIVKDSTPMLRCFASETLSTAGLTKAFDTSWYNTYSAEFVLTTREQLYGFTMLSNTMDFNGYTIKLGADIVVNEGNAKDWAKKEPEYMWYPINKFYGTFDGQGHTISGLYLDTDIETSGFIRETYVTATVKNLNIKNSYMRNTTEKNAIIGSVVGRGRGNFENLYSDAIIVSSGVINGGIVGQVNGKENNKVSNCWFDGSISTIGKSGRYTGGVLGNVVQGTTIVEHCLNTGTVSSEFEGAPVYAGGIMGNVSGSATILTINDCLNVGKIITKHDVCVGSVIGRIPKGPTVTITNTFATTDTFQHPKSGFLGVGNQSVDTYTGGVVGYDREYLTDINAYKYTTLDFASYWAARKSDTPVLAKHKSGNLSVAGSWRLDTSWYNSEKKSFTLKNMQQFYGFAMLVNSGNSFEEKTIKLGADIVLNSGSVTEWATGNVTVENKWIPIGNSNAIFKGTFDGQGHTISGVYSDVGKTQYNGLFGFAINATIKNFSLTNSYFVSTADDADMGSVLGYGDGVLENIYSDAILNAKGIRVGGLLGVSQDKKTDGASGAAENSKTVIKNCWFNGTINLNYDEPKSAYSGGLLGYPLHGTVNFKHALFTGTIYYNNLGEKNDAAKSVIIGGFLGRTNPGVAVTIEDSLSAGYFHAENAKVSNVRSITGRTNDSVTVSSTVYATKDFASTTGVAALLPISADTIQGIQGYRRTQLDFANYWAARVASVPALKLFVNDADKLATAGVTKAIVADTSWINDGTGSKRNPYIISDAADLYGLAQLVNKGTSFDGEHIKLASDIVINSGWDADSTVVPDEIWEPIGTSSNRFEGTFDGNFKTISGLYTNTDVAATGLFGYTRNSTIKNLYLINSSFTTTASPAQLGSIIGYGDGVIDQVYSDTNLTACGQRVGGLIGCVQNSKDGKSYTNLSITNSWYAGDINVEGNKNFYTGGIIGSAVYGPITVENCIVSGNINGTYTGSDSDFSAMAGGILGGCANKNVELNIENCEVAAQISVKSSSTGVEVGGVGSAIGRLRPGEFTIKNIYIAKELGGMSTIGVNETSVSVVATSVDFEKTIEVTNTYVALKGAVGANNRNIFNTPWVQWEVKNDIPVLVFDASVSVKDGVDVTWYTKVANGVGSSEDSPYLISDEADLYGLVELVNDNGVNFAGKYIKLENDIILNRTWTAGTSTVPDDFWEPIGTSKSGSDSFQGTFDGNYKTISGLYTYSNVGGVGLFGYAKNCTIKNLYLTNSEFISTVADGSAAHGLGSIIGYGDGVLDQVYSDAYLTKDFHRIGGLIGCVQDGTNTTQFVATNCWYAGIITQNYDGAFNTGGFVGIMNYGSTVIENCLYSGHINGVYTGSESNFDTSVGGVIGSYSTSLSTTIKNSQILGDMQVEGTDVGVGTITGFLKSPNFIAQNVYTAKTYADRGCRVYSALKEGTSTDVTTYVVDYTDAQQLANVIIAFNDAVLQNNKQIGAKAWTNWQEKDYKPALMFGEIVLPGDAIDTRWYDEATSGVGDSEANPYKISTRAELYGLAVLVNRADNPVTFENKYIQLQAPIVINENWTAGATAPTNCNQWIAIGSSSNPFKGHFDGNHNTISGIYMNTASQNTGLFGYTRGNVEVKNLTLTNCYFKSSQTYLGAIIGYGEGILENIYITKTVTLNSTAGNVGGFIGYVKGSSNPNTKLEIESCWFDGKIISSANNVGGFAGYICGGGATNNSIKHSLFSGEIDASAGGSTIGGFVGRSNGNTGKITITDSLSAGKITASATATKVGAIAGQGGNGNGTQQSTIIDATVYATSDYCTYAIGDNKGYSGTLNALVPEANIKGESAKTNTGVPNLLYDTEWKTKTNFVPVPILFKDVVVD